MFLYQKLKYDYKHIVDTYAIDQLMELAKTAKPIFTCFDTETTGLNIITDKPFLMAVGFGKTVRTFDFDKDLIHHLWKRLKEINLESNEGYLGMGAHNCKYDYHMCTNKEAPIPKDIKLFDCKTVARLTEYADDEHTKLSLEALGTKYVDENSKFAGKVIKNLVSSITKRRKDILREKLMDEFPDEGFFTTTKDGTKRGTAKLTETLKAWEKRVRFIDDDNPIFNFITANFKKANYEDVYHEEPELMRSYAADDIVIMIEYLNKSLPVLAQLDPNYRVFSRDDKLIKTVAKMERVGMRVDVDYVLECRKKVQDYKQQLYMELEIYTGKTFTAGQHELIKKILKKQYGVIADTTDDKALSYIIKEGKGEVVDVVTNIQELRTVDKWLSTYIDGKLNSLIDGRTYTEIDNNGAVTGRISCNMQQQPKKALYTRDGLELFHPRQMYIADEGYNFFFIDESQMELRVQAEMTILHSHEPDTNLCRAYIPYQCKHYKTGELYDYKDLKYMDRWDEKKEGSDESAWLDSSGKPWTPTDLHTQTTSLAFPTVPIDTPEFELKRAMGKQANFLKVYAGGLKALMDEIGIDRETAIRLDDAFYASYPRVKDYMQWVEKTASLYGYTENLYGRRYYMSNSAFFYKLCNYLIQGSCADMFKLFEVRIDDYLESVDSGIKMVLPVHDELIFLVPYGMEHHVTHIKEMMEDTRDTVKHIPMIADVDYSGTNWRNKKKGWSYETYYDGCFEGLF